MNFFDSFLERTRSRNGVAIGVPSSTRSWSASFSDTVTRIIFFVPTSAFTKTAFASSRLNTTVFL